MKYTNKQKISLSMAVFLANDDYDYDPRPNSISGTGLLKSVKQTIMAKRSISGPNQEMDISQLVSSSVGTAIHDGVEHAWTGGRYKKALLKLGEPQQKIDRIKVFVGDDEPTSADIDKQALPNMTRQIPVYIEKRSERNIDGFIVSGKFDFVGDGQLEDHKTTGVYTYIKNTNDDKFRMQGSIYRWLNQGIITSDSIQINYTFTDFSALRASIEANKGYPPYKVMSVHLPLYTLDETEAFIKTKLKALKDNINVDEDKLPPCTKEELWQDDTIYKYYKNPAKTDRSTKNFKNFAEAQAQLMKDGQIGIVKIVQGEAKYCKYCPALGICSQAKDLIAAGLLSVEE